MTSAAQTRPTPIQRDTGMGSPATTTPHRNCRVGLMYCSTPRVARGRRRAPAAKSSSGIAVTGPAATSSSAWPAPNPVNVPAPVIWSPTRKTIASGPSRKPSAVSPGIGSSGTRFLTSPYSPKLTASVRVIHGSWPVPTVRTTTAAAASPIASHCTGRSRSRSTTTASSTDTSGVP